MSNLEKDERKEHVMKEKNNGILYVIIALLLSIVVFGFIYEFYLRDVILERTSNETVFDINKSNEKKNITINETGLADAVEKVYDSVVIIENYVNGKLTSSGSGFVFKVDNEYGYILTNNHVTKNSSEIKVTFTNNKTVVAKLVGSDDYSDISVLSVPKNSIVLVADMGSSDNMRVGDTTFAVGAPLDATVYSWSVTRGILSGKNRVVETSDSVMEVLQTDAAINSGNSGGPLCNINGEVIGITNMKIASSTVEGIGFAIPIETALEVANSIITGESIKRPYLGVTIYEGSKRWTLETSVYINSVEKGSTAEKAGLQEGDKIVKVGDVSVNTVATFKYNLYKYNLGDKVKLTIERDNKTFEVEVTIKSK